MKMLLSLLSLLSLPAFAASLPNPAVTPGAIDTYVTQDNIHATICAKGYTKKVRPFKNLTTHLKYVQLGSTYRDPASTLMPWDYQEDHLVPLELGGNPTDVKNLWPEPIPGQSGAHVKDKCENRAHALVCSGKLNLADAQFGFASNWVSFCSTLGIR